jgi:hypothetical protein
VGITPPTEVRQLDHGFLVGRPVFCQNPLLSLSPKPKSAPVTAGRRASAWPRKLALASTFVLGLFAATVLLRLAHPRPLPFEVLLKEDAFARGDFDTLFIGSSRIYRHIIPAVFDEQMKTFGGKTRSFNFGLDGMRPPESFYYSRSILQAGSHRLKWVFVELCPLFTKLQEANAEGERTVGWHDASDTLLVLRENHNERPAWPELLRLDLLHLESFALRQGNLGGGIDLVRHLHGTPPNLQKVPAEWRPFDGFSPDGRSPAVGKKRDQLEATIQAASAHPAPRALPPLLRGTVRDLADCIRRCGATPVFVVMPTLRPQENLASLREQGIDAEFISLASVDRFPELYRLDLRADADHFVGAGPKLITSALARESAGLFAPRGSRAVAFTEP